jgi:LacI family transcriptional regulator
MSPKLEDIANRTGFSIATISRVLSNSQYPVKLAVREQILQAAREMGYKPNLSARSLRTDRTNTIGILVDDLMSPFTPTVVRGIQDYLKDKDFMNLIVNSDWDPEQERSALDALISRPVDGIIFVEYSHLTSNEALEKSNKPGVFVHRLFGTKIHNSVVPDDCFGAELAVKHLVSLGHRKIAFISGPESWYSSKERLSGYRDELERSGVGFNSDWVMSGDWEVDGGYQATKRLLQLKDRPTAIFAGNDLMALGAVYAIQDAGLSVPNDIAVVGYDNREFTRIVRPGITTVVMPVYEMGRIAAEMMLNQIAEGKREDDEIKVKGELIVRDTCGADESQKTKEKSDYQTSPRWMLLHKHPES